MPNSPPSRIKPYLISLNAEVHSSFGIAKELNALNATITTAIGLTRLALTAASPMISPPTIPIVPLKAPGIRIPASRISSNASSINNTSRRLGNGTPCRDSAKDRIRLVGRIIVWNPITARYVPDNKKEKSIAAYRITRSKEAISNRL